MLTLVESPASHPKFPENGLPYRGSPFSQEGPHFTGNMGTPSPHIPGKMGTRVPIFLGVWGPGVLILRGPHFHITPDLNGHRNRPIGVITLR